MTRLGSRRGAGLLMSIMALTALGGLTVATVTILRSLKRESLQQARLVKARALADAGIENALLSLSKDPDWRTGFSGQPLDGGTYNVSLTTHTRPWVTATGYAPALQLLARPFRTARVRVQPLRVPRMRYGIQVDGDLSLGSNSIDGYDAEVNADPNPSGFTSIGEVWTNGRPFFSPVAVRGSATYFVDPGPVNGTVIGGTVTKSTFTLSPAFPDLTAFAADNDNLTGISPQSAYEASTRHVSAPGGNTVTLKTGVYYLGDVTVSGTLNVDASEGPVVMYVTGTLSLTGTVNNVSKLPANLAIYVQNAGTVTINPDEFRGVVYAPLAAIALNAPVYGALLSSTLVMGARGVVHHDVSLGRRAQTPIRTLSGTWEEPAGRI